MGTWLVLDKPTSPTMMTAGLARWIHFEGKVTPEEQEHARPFLHVADQASASPVNLRNRGRRNRARLKLRGDSSPHHIVEPPARVGMMK
jgi:hypothetical protein